MGSAIVVDDISKRFKLYHEKYTSLKERVIHFGRTPHDEFWALRNIQFEIQQGETVGLLGHNGSGKSTLLKCIAGILQPTSGIITRTGTMAALLELGAGFHPELSGRDNIYLNASLLGLSKRDIDARFDEIVEFAELEAFIDNQVKHYSSGMYVRLGFAVAVNMEPDILLVDEVLAVGDESFQRKCLDRVRQFQRDGRTIVVVTHAADLVRQICDRAVVLDHGNQVAIGSPADAVRSFREHLLQKQGYADPSLEDDVPSQEEKRTFVVRIDEVTMEHANSRQRAHLLPGEPLAVRIRHTAKDEVDDVVFGIAVYDLEGRLLFGANSALLGADCSLKPGTGETTFELASIPLLDGDYLVTVGVHSRDEATVYDWHEQQYRFSVLNPGKEVGLVYVPVNFSVSSTGSIGLDTGEAAPAGTGGKV